MAICIMSSSVMPAATSPRAHTSCYVQIGGCSYPVDLPVVPLEACTRASSRRVTANRPNG